MTEAVISIEGMSCMHCVARVKKALEALSGISDLNVSVGSASLRFDESVVSRREIEEAIVKAGYRIKS